MNHIANSLLNMHAGEKLIRFTHQDHILYKLTYNKNNFYQKEIKQIHRRWMNIF